MAVLKVKRDGRTYWAAVVNYRDDDGKRRQLRLNAPTRADAKLHEATLLKKRAEGATPSRATVHHFIDLWLTRLAERSDIRPSTVKAYRDRLAHLTAAYGALRLAQLTTAQLDALYGTLSKSGRAPKTILEVHRVVRKALGDAVRWGAIMVNPAENARPPKPTKFRYHVATVDDLRTLFDAADPLPVGPLIRVAAWTGARLGELLALRWRDVDLDAGTLSVAKTLSNLGGEWEPKTESGFRRIRLSPETVAVLSVLPRSGERVFPFSHTDVATAWRGLRKQTGFDRLRFHDLRHAHATHMLRQGFPVSVVSARLGHANASITLGIYTHALPDQDADLAKAVDLHMR